MADVGDDRSSIHSPEHDIIRGEELRRLFTNRKNLTDVFERKLKQSLPVPILMFYGVGGSGKTWMIHFLQQESCRAYNCPYAYINFRRGYTDFDPVNFLRDIRYQLGNREKQLRFPRFDIVWGKYWERTHEGLSIKHTSLLLPEEAGVIADVLSVLQDVPLVGVVPRMLNSLLKFGGWVHSEWARRKVVDWLQIHVGSDCYHRLNMMLPVEFYRLLPAALAADLTDGTATLHQRPIIFVDTYENLEDPQCATNRTIIEEVAEQLRALKTNALLLISGRNRLRWAERYVNAHWELDPDSVWAQGVTRNDHETFIGTYLEQYLLGDLSKQDAIDYLKNKRQIGDQKLWQELYQLTRGYALALGTAADLLEDAGSTGSSKVSELNAVLAGIVSSENWRETLNSKLLECLLEQLIQQRREDLVGVLRAASILRWFTEDLLFTVVQILDGTFQDKFERLVGYSFIEPREVIGGEPVYRIHPTMQDLLRKGIRPVSQKVCWQERARDYFKAKAERMRAQTGSNQEENKFTYQVEQLYHTFEVDTTDAIRLLQELFEYSGKRFRWADCARLMEAAKDHVSLDARAKSYVRFYEGELLLGYMPLTVSPAFGLRFHENEQSDYQASLDVAIRAYEESLELQTESGDNALIPRCLLRKGELLSTLGQPSEVVATLKDAWEVSKQLAQRSTEAQAMHHLATYEHASNPYRQNEDYLQKALTIFRDLDDEFWIAEVLKDITLMYVNQGKVAAAVPHAEEALTVAEQLNNPNTVARARHTLGRALYNSGQYDRSLPFYRQALTEFETLGDIGGIASCSRTIGMIFRDREPPDYAEARKYLEKALDLDEKLRSPWGVARNHYEIARWYIASGQPPSEAVDHAKRARDLWRDIGHPDIEKAEKLLAQLMGNTT